ELSEPARSLTIITEYMDILKPLKTATKRLKGRGKSGSFRAIAEIIPIFEYLLTYYEQRVNAKFDWLEASNASF
ncbi:hypothetical protein A1F95_10995, partial [Pyrenophora tritici-repentis]